MVSFDSMKSDKDINSPSVLKFETGSNVGTRDRKFVSEVDNRASTTQASNVAVEEFYFAPIAFVIQTEVEHHDIFKEVMLMLFESIRSPAVVNNDEQED